jgi:hypothetical protein
MLGSMTKPAEEPQPRDQYHNPAALGQQFDVNFEPAQQADGEPAISDRSLRPMRLRQIGTGVNAERALQDGEGENRIQLRLTVKEESERR